MYYSTIYPSPIGNITLACDHREEKLVGLWIAGQKYHGGTMSDLLKCKDGILLFVKVKKWLDRYFDKKKPEISELPLATIGSEFRQEVWKILCGIPYGEVITYGEIAGEMAVNLGRGSISAQAIGTAVGHNPISIIVPCHRVVGLNGSLTGYAGGIKIKVQLLELEGVDMSRLFVPKKGTAL